MCSVPGAGLRCNGSLDLAPRLPSSVPSSVPDPLACLWQLPICCVSVSSFFFKIPRTNEIIQDFSSFLTHFPRYGALQVRPCCDRRQDHLLLGWDPISLCTVSVSMYFSLYIFSLSTHSLVAAWVVSVSCWWR